MQIIARIRTDFPDKFGIPRQSSLIEESRGEIVFEPAFRVREAVRGLEEYSHLWLIWEFSEHVGKKWSPTVRPPRLGGNKRIGVFATRSPFRPNPIGLSCVRLEAVRWNEKEGPVLVVSGVDLMDGTPIYDIKPYLAYVDAHPEASDSFAGEHRGDHLAVEWSHPEECSLPEEKKQALRKILAQDPRPHYQDDPGRIYSMDFAGHRVRFRVENKTAYICSIDKTAASDKGEK